MMEYYPKSRTARKSSLPRCINLDWLEVHCREPQLKPLDMWYYKGCGFVVHDRGYGTRVYKEMFTIEGADGENLLEIRRNPASQGLIGIHDANECHIRLCNRTCYFNNAAEFLDGFLKQHGYYDIRISRVDVCLDFVKFDEGDLPQIFVKRYLRHKFTKINQGNISSHGSDTWNGQVWNSLSWGSKSSPISTKMYNKTIELYDPKLDRFKKPYIREAWKCCGLIDDVQRVTKDGQLVDVWRVEFSIRSSRINWVPIEIDGIAKNYQSLRNQLSTYMGRDRLLVMFASLARHYFRFKKFKPNIRKDSCKDKRLFDFSSNELVYKLERPSAALGSGESFVSRYHRLLEHLKAYSLTHTGADIHKACDTLIAAIIEEDQRADLVHAWDNEELKLLRSLVMVRTHNKELTYEAALSEVKKLLGITDRTINTF